MRKKLVGKIVLTSITALIAGGLLVACGGGSSSSSTTTTSDSNYSGPGSKYDVTLASDGSFEVTHRETAASAIDMTVSGSYTRQSNGIVKLDISGAVDASGATLLTPANGDVAWAIDVPDYAFFLKPMGDGDQLVPMVISSSCPTTDFNGNWLNVNTEATGDATSTARDYFGTFSYIASSGAADVASKYSLANMTSNLGATSLNSGTCSDGLMTVAAGTSNESLLYLSPKGAIVRTGTFTPTDETDDKFIFAFTTTALSSIADLDGNYAGMLFDDNLPTNNKIAPVNMTCNATGTCTAQQIDEADLTTVIAGDYDIDFTGSTINSPSDGFIVGTGSDGTGTGNLSCNVDTTISGGKTMINCVGQSPSDNTKLFNVLFVSI